MNISGCMETPLMQIIYLSRNEDNEDFRNG